MLQAFLFAFDPDCGTDTNLDHTAKIIVIPTGKAMNTYIADASVVHTGRPEPPIRVFFSGQIFRISHFNKSTGFLFRYHINISMI